MIHFFSNNLLLARVMLERAFLKVILSVCLFVCPSVCYTREPHLRRSHYRNIFHTVR